ncbi:MAG: hypothetical protein ACFFCW_28090 [Candidatus Hodarchaeota archaeon]
MSQWGPPLRPGLVTLLGALLLIFGLFFLFQFIAYEETNRLKTLKGSLARLVLAALFLGFAIYFILISLGIFV